MNFACEKCQRRYTVADEKVRGKTLRVRCKGCQHVITVTGPPGEGTSAAPAPTPAAAHGWFAMLQGKQVGPLDLTALLAKMASGEINARTYTWHEGMADWKRVADVPELAAALSSQEKPSPPVLPPAPIPRASPRTGSHGVASSPTPESAVALGEVDPSRIQPASENTSFYIARAGLNRRNPPWKVAAFVVLLIALPVCVLYMLSELRVVPLQVTRVNEAGEEVTQSILVESVSGLRDLLMGKKPAPVKAAPRASAAPPAPQEKPPPPAVKAPPRPAGPSKDELAALYGDAKKVDVGPRVSRREPVPAPSTDEGGGPPEQDVARVVAQTQTAFQFCIEQEMKKNPAFRGGKIHIMATVGASGVVKRAAIDRHDIDASPLGECLKSKARRMAFAAFSGDDVDLEIPLILTTTM